MEASKEMNQYFESIRSTVKKSHEHATLARAKGYDPADTVEVQLAENMAERVVGLISVLAPQIVGSGVVDRIIELEKIYGILDWRVAFKIAEEIAREKFCKFKEKKEAIEIGVRTGFAYVTVGVVSSPLDGLIDISLKNRMDNNGQYFCLNFAGPIRNAGGTAASVCILIADYVRNQLGYPTYDATEDESKRAYVEVIDYIERCAPRQHTPVEEEMLFLMKHLPVEVNGDPSERFEVSSHKDLPRIKTNIIRSGFCLVMTDCIPLKAPKLWKQLSKWGEEFNMHHWNFLKEFIEIQKNAKAKGEKKEDSGGVAPNYAFVKEIVAGRPVLGYPLENGAFRLRYGRCRFSGYSAQSIHPATMHVLQDYIATGTQLKTERPGKATSLTMCDTIDGPIVKLENGDVLFLETLQQAKSVENVKEIIYLGDILVAYGDFLDRAHTLIPAGYCEEWWVQELEREIVNRFGTIAIEKVAFYTELSDKRIKEILDKPAKIRSDEALTLSLKLNIPLHPRYTHYWNSISNEDLELLLTWLKNAKIIRNENSYKLILPKNLDAKRVLELAGVPHSVKTEEVVVINEDYSTSIYITLLSNHENIGIDKTKTTLENINLLSPIVIKDKLGVFIGTRMGRPEKAKQRKMTGSPHMTFPVGDEGGRLRCMSSVLKKQKVTSDFPAYYCKKCDHTTVFRRCEQCDGITIKQFYCRSCEKWQDTEECSKHGKNQTYKRRALKILPIFRNVLKKLKMNKYPDLIKGVRGTSNKNHIPEHIAKGILRSKNDVYVFKDGTTRFDMTQIPMTHFKPLEVGTSIEKLKELGYIKDIHGVKLTSQNQILELKPQDVVLPRGIFAGEDGADRVLLKVSKFIDDLLKNFYGIDTYYNAETGEDLVGELVICLAPHTSAGTIGRIIGYSKTQGFWAHPLVHAATRRDCFSYETYIPIFMNNHWQIRQIGEIVEYLKPNVVVDDFNTKEIRVKGIKTIGFDKRGNIIPVPVNNFTKHSEMSMVEIKTSLGRTLKVTNNHKQITFANGKQKIVPAIKLRKGDVVGIPYTFKIKTKDCHEVNLLNYLKDQEWVMVRGANSVVKNISKFAKEYFSKKDYYNYFRRDSYPLDFILSLEKQGILKSPKDLFVAAKFDTIKIPAIIPLTNELLQLIGLYVAEGFSRKIGGKKGLFQLYIASENTEIRIFIKEVMWSIFGLKPSERKKDRVTFSSRVLYHLFVEILKCGTHAYNKRMPYLLLNLPHHRLGYLLSGYFEGDGSVSKTDLRITFDTVSEGLLRDIDFILNQMGIFVKNYAYTKEPGNRIKEFYIRKKRKIPNFTITKGVIQSLFVHKLSHNLNFISKKKQDVLDWLINNRKPRKIKQKFDDKLMFDTITSISHLPKEESYCLNVENNQVLANTILSKQCDGDESCIILLMDAFLNFSKEFLPESRGGTMDAPLVLTTLLNPAEVDDMVFQLDIEWRYPLEFYEAALQYKKPWDVKLKTINETLGTINQFEGMGFTHDITDMNDTVRCSAYKTIPSMEDKLKGQMQLAEKIRAVDTSKVATLVIEKHFMKDSVGNLRKFTQQTFRCVKCNQKFRRAPLITKCTKCGGKIILTVSKGNISKYIQPTMSLAKKYEVSSYLQQTIELLQKRMESVFIKEKEQQLGLGAWFG
ncbi:DNA polymerase II large subunit [Nanoarchaeota archaeon]